MQPGISWTYETPAVGLKALFLLYPISWSPTKNARNLFDHIVQILIGLERRKGRRRVIRDRQVIDTNQALFPISRRDRIFLPPCYRVGGRYRIVMIC